MPQQPSDNWASPLDPSDYELPPEPTKLSPRRRPAGKPAVKADTAKPTSVKPGGRIVMPGLGKVSIVIH